MVKVYATLIINKRPGRGFDKVPDAYKAAVAAHLKELGYDTNGDPIV